MAPRPWGWERWLQRLCFCGFVFLPGVMGRRVPRCSGDKPAKHLELITLQSVKCPMVCSLDLLFTPSLHSLSTV